MKKTRSRKSRDTVPLIPTLPYAFPSRQSLLTVILSVAPSIVWLLNNVYNHTGTMVEQCLVYPSWSLSVLFPFWALYRWSRAGRMPPFLTLKSWWDDRQLRFHSEVKAPQIQIPLAKERHPLTDFFVRHECVCVPHSMSCTMVKGGQTNFFCPQIAQSAQILRPLSLSQI